MQGRGIIPQHIVAQSTRTYVLLLSLVICLGACPEADAGGQRQEDRNKKPLPAPLLPAEEAWNVPLPAPPSAPGALDAMRTYVPLQSGQLVALDRETGTIEWSIPIASSWPPVVGADTVYVAGTSEFHAVRTTTGETVWKVPVDAEPMAAPLVQGDAILVLQKPDQLRALRRTDGSEMWKATIDAQSSSLAMATDANGVCVVSGSHVRRFALADGHTLWDRELAGVLGRPVIAGNRVFVGSTDNYFYALDTGNGRLAWRLRAGGDVVGSVTDDRFVYVAALDNLLRALHRGSGNQIWKRDLATRTIAPPATFGGIVIVSGNDPTLSTFDATTGTPISMFSLQADLQGVLLLDSSLKPFRVGMVAVTRDAHAIGLRPVGMMFREPATTPLQALPGKALSREPLQAPRARTSGHTTTGASPTSPASDSPEVK